MMRRDSRMSKQGVGQVGNTLLGSADVSTLRSEIQQALESVQQRPVISLTMVFPTIGVVRHG
jgi:hypothetical protein